MSNYKHFNMSDDGIVKNVVSISDDEMVCRDVMPGNVVEKILEDNAEVRNNCLHNRRAEGRLAARIPVTQYYEWRKQWHEKGRQYVTWHTFLAAKLNDRDYSYLRTQTDKIHIPDNVRTGG